MSDERVIEIIPTALNKKLAAAIAADEVIYERFVKTPGVFCRFTKGLFKGRVYVVLDNGQPKRLYRDDLIREQARVDDCPNCGGEITKSPFNYCPACRWFQVPSDATKL